MQPNPNLYDVIIVGGGPAGLASAISTSRNNLETLIIEKTAVGGQIADSPLVENYPSQEPQSGLELIDKMQAQVERFGVKIEFDEIKSLERTDGIFHLHGEYADYQSRSVIIASGVEHRHLNIEGEERLLGHGVSYCALCDGPFYQGQDVAVIGDGNSAVQYALLLTKYCPKVHVCTLFDHFFADKVLVDKLLENKNVVWHKNVASTSFLGIDELKAINFVNSITQAPFSLEVKAVFVAIGQIPHNEAFLPFVDLKDGYILTDETMKTKTPGLFAAGDCRNKEVRQVATAIGDAATAALMVSRYLDTQS